MKEDWKNVDFGLASYRDQDISVLSAVDDVQLLLDDHVVKTHTMKGSPFIEPFKDEIQIWEETLVRKYGFRSLRSSCFYDVAGSFSIIG